ncbi:LuxR C-terminal-related transcriptional regulator [Mycolicibacterium vaccae]|uniref:Two-component regulator n=1 Tax=Mycolicibacterium vaccae ATCC 25954 TaxID=1194972 RepID=K0VKK8_MYCVA|nr:response regulator transcription factor [Mycolicibacterium vaccae]ANI42212.1 two-component regulator [Mycolicibacterium vaccae 95051]EJZ11684.1 two-component regulator [Mycolicibacterium vaccae ATCC 25954]
MTGPFTNGEQRTIADGNVLIIDDCTLYREALASSLTENGLRAVRTVGDLPSLISALNAIPPLVILLNLATVGVQTILRAIKGLSPRVPVIAIGASLEDERALMACAEAGVAAYHMRADTLAGLLTLIHGVVNGEVSCPPEVSAILFRIRALAVGPRRPVVRDPGLTSREIQILKLLRLGCSNQEIATQLSIAVHTVKSHVHSLLTKLGVSSRAEAAALSHDLDLDRGPHDGTGSGSSRNWS